MYQKTIELRNEILQKLPEGSVVTAHTEHQHFYKVTATGDLYPSVTGKLQILKEEGLSDWKMNQALNYVSMHFNKFTEANVMEHIQAASKTSSDIFEDAGDIGTFIHDIREAYFSHWISTGERPNDIMEFIHRKSQEDKYAGFAADPRNQARAISAMRALEKFCTEYEYEPVFTELYLYSHIHKLGGALDDLGTMLKIEVPGDPNCLHEPFRTERKDRFSWKCMHCKRRGKRIFVLLDLKTSNQFKNHYFFQVALYYDMLRELTGMTPHECFILKVSKTDGTYKIENLKKPKKLAQYARHVLKVNEAVEFIKELRHDNQKKVEKLII